MDFITGFPRTSRQHDSIMVVVEILTKVAHFIQVNSNYSATNVAHVFIRDIVRLHGVSKNIMSNRDAKFTSWFWKELFVGLSIELAFSTTYHPQIDGQKERINGIFKDTFKMYVMHQQWKLEEYLPLVEFACNNGY